MDNKGGGGEIYPYPVQTPGVLGQEHPTNSFFARPLEVQTGHGNELRLFGPRNLPYLNCLCRAPEIASI